MQEDDSPALTFDRSIAHHLATAQVHAEELAKAIRGEPPHTGPHNRKTERLALWHLAKLVRALELDPGGEKQWLPSWQRLLCDLDLDGRYEFRAGSELLVGLAPFSWEDFDDLLAAGRTKQGQAWGRAIAKSQPELDGHWSQWLRNPRVVVANERREPADDPSLLAIAADHVSNGLGIAAKHWKAVEVSRHGTG